MAPNEDVLVEKIQLCTINDFCRLCANLNDNMVPIYTDEGADYMLENKIKIHLPFIKISKNDLLPKRICYQCASAVLVWNELYDSSSDADLKLRSMFEASPFDQNQDKNVSYADIEEIITVPVNDFIGDSIKYEEINDISIFNKNEKLDTNLNELDKTPSTYKTDNILNHELKSSVIIQEDEQLNPSLKSGISTMFGRVDDENLEDHMYLDVMGIGGNINELINCRPLDMSSENRAVVISKREEDYPDNDSIDVEQMVDKDVLPNADDNVHLHLQYQQQKHHQKLQQQQQNQKPKQQHQEPEQQHGVEVYVSLNGVTADLDDGDAAEVSDDQIEYRSQISSFVDGDDSCNDVDPLIKRVFDGEANSSGGRRRCNVTRGTAASSIKNDFEDNVNNSAVVNNCSPINMEVQYMATSLDVKNSGQDSLENERMCPVCATKFKTRYNLLRHFQKRHPELEMHECDLCRICFPSVNEFKEHLKQKHSKVYIGHSNEMRFACEVCGYLYKNMSSAINHLLTHTTHKTVRCPHCDYMCHTKQQLMVHQTKHDKRFFCNVCQKRFAQKSQLDVHITAVHYNHRPFTCMICDKSFKTKGSHDAHMITHTDTRNYQCPYCDKKSRKQYDLTLHIRTHTGEKPFKCSICGRGFVQLCDTRKHEKLHFKPGRKKI